MRLARLALAAGAVLAFAPAAHAADPVEGLWLVQGGGAKVRISACAADKARMCGQVTWLKQTDKAGNPLKDLNNPDPALRNRPIVGMLMIRDFKQSGPGRWTGGKIYDPGSGKSYASKMTVNPDGALKVEGCVAVICQAQTWKRTS